MKKFVLSSCKVTKTNAMKTDLKRKKVKEDTAEYKKSTEESQSQEQSRIIGSERGDHIRN